MSGLGFNISTSADRAVVEVSGDVDVATAPDLLEAILAMHTAADWQDVTVDLGGVAFMDSSGLATLVLARRRLAANRCRLRIDNARPGVVKVLEVSGVGDYLNDEELPT